MLETWDDLKGSCWLDLFLLIVHMIC
jgi:hypothetical protein